MTNRFAAISSIIRSKELIDVAFRRGSKSASKISRKIPRHVRLLKKEQSRIKAIMEYLCNRLELIVKQFPSIDKLHPFFFELVSTLVDVDALRQHLAAVYGAITVIRRISTDGLKRLRKSKNDAVQLRIIRRQTLGRIGSVINRLDGHLEFLEETRRKLRTMPSIDPNQPTIVVAGAPNTGKSTLVRNVSSARPEIAYYPFTTRSLVLGHIPMENKGFERIQIVDTPGLLDRPINERNEIEKQAIAALRFLASVIIFLFDVSETNGYTLSYQLRLYEEIKHTLPHIPYLIAFNKIDLAMPEQVKEAHSYFHNSPVFELVAAENRGTSTIRDAAVNLVVSQRDIYG
ncbi:MAG: NOG1 family protein [Candidatus Ranarchaeia archaeon]